MNNKVALLVDDDSVLVRALLAQIRFFFSERNLDLEVCTAFEQFPGVMATVGGRSVAVAIIDLWMIDKRTNTQNTQAGYSIIEQLRKKWPQCYIVVLSAHIDAEVQKHLAAYNQLTILEKPIPTFVLEDVLDNLLQKMGLCPISGSLPA